MGETMKKKSPDKLRNANICLEYLNGVSQKDLSIKYNLSKGRINQVVRAWGSHLASRVLNISFQEAMASKKYNSTELIPHWNEYLRIISNK